MNLISPFQNPFGFTQSMARFFSLNDAKTKKILACVSSEWKKFADFTQYKNQVKMRVFIVDNVLKLERRFTFGYCLSHEHVQVLAKIYQKGLTTLPFKTAWASLPFSIKNPLSLYLKDNKFDFDMFDVIEAFQCCLQEPTLEAAKFKLINEVAKKSREGEFAQVLLLIDLAQEEPQYEQENLLTPALSARLETNDYVGALFFIKSILMNKEHKLKVSANEFLNTLLRTKKMSSELKFDLASLLNSIGRIEEANVMFHELDRKAETSPQVNPAKKVQSDQKLSLDNANSTKHGNEEEWCHKIYLLLSEQSSSVLTFISQMNIPTPQKDQLLLALAQKAKSDSAHELFGDIVMQIFDMDLVATLF
jgi:hypothetical protein